MSKELLTLQELAELSGLSVRFWREEVAHKRIGYIQAKPNAPIRIPVQAYEDWKARHYHKPIPR
jgi:hypothetical protein